jgi:3-deoxy-manno-octulosonate cytidylyltransferase (CMP-KDO synthetase)
MIEHVYRRAAAAPSVASVVVATDDERIFRAVEAFGGNVRMTSAAYVSGTDRVAEVVEGLDCDLVVNVQGDEPLLDPAMIEEVVAMMLADASVGMGTLRRRMEHSAEQLDPNVVKVVVDRAGFALYFSRAPIPFARGCGSGVPSRPAAGTFRHVGLYAYRRELLLELARLSPTPLELAESLEQLRALEYGYRIRTVETIHGSVAVDTPEDLELVRRAAAPAQTWNL